MEGDRFFVCFQPSRSGGGGLICIAAFIVSISQTVNHDTVRSVLAAQKDAPAIEAVLVFGALLETNNIQTTKTPSDTLRVHNVTRVSYLTTFLPLFRPLPGATAGPSVAGPVVAHRRIRTEGKGHIHRYASANFDRCVIM